MITNYFIHKLNLMDFRQSGYSFCPDCGVLIVNLFRGYCTMRIHKGTNEVFGTTFSEDTPIGIIADFVEEHDDGTPEYADLVEFLREWS